MIKHVGLISILVVLVYSCFILAQRKTEHFEYMSKLHVFKNNSAVVQKNVAKVNSINIYNLNNPILSANQRALPLKTGDLLLMFHTIVGKNEISLVNSGIDTIYCDSEATAFGVQVLCRCFEMNVKINISEKIEPGNAYAILVNDKKDKRISKLEQIHFDIINYNMNDDQVARLGVFMPYASLKGLDVSLSFFPKRRFKSTYKLVNIPHLLLTSNPIETVPDVDHEAFALHDYIRSHSTQRIYEMFNEQNVILKTTKDIIGIHLLLNENGFKMIRLPYTSINDIVLKTGDVLEIGQQLYPEENGTFFIVGSYNSFVIAATHPVIDDRDIKDLQTTNGKTSFSNPDSNHFPKQNLVYIPTYNMFGKVNSKTNRIELIDVDDTNEYSCYSNHNLLTKEVCESKYDVIGSPKLRKDVWDKQCKQNSDCPFYMKNVNYKNYRGGCNNGYCEMPLGMNQISYRKYDANSLPICYGCNVSDTTCCEKQLKPDYAFKGDRLERMKYGMNII